MKFNFEKAKNIAKKTAIGAGVVASSFSNLEAQVVEPTLDEKTINPTEVFNDALGKEALNQKTKEETEKQRIASDQQKIQEIEKDLGILKESNNPDDPEYYRNEYLKYMEHPSYKQRLAKEMFGDEIIDEEKQQLIDSEYDERIRQIKKVPIKILLPGQEHTSRYSPIRDDVETTPHAAFHELSHSVDYRKGNTTDKGFEEKKIENFLVNDNLSDLESKIDELYKEKYFALEKIGSKEYRENHQRFIEILRKYIDDNKNNDEFKKNNNYNQIKNSLNDLNSSFFDLQDFYKNFNYLDQLTIIKENRNLLYSLEPYQKEKSKYDTEINELINYLDYLRANTEIKARLNYLRMKAIREYNFDLNNDFDINKFNELKSDSQYKDLKEGLGLSDEQINELMKYTAFNDEIKDTDKTYFHPGWDYGAEKDNQT